MQKVIDNEVKNLTKVPEKTAVQLFELERAADAESGSVHSQAARVDEVTIASLFAGIDDAVSGLKKKNKPELSSVPEIDKESLVWEINEVAHRYDNQSSNYTGLREPVQVRSLNIF